MFIIVIILSLGIITTGVLFATGILKSHSDDRKKSNTKNTLTHESPSITDCGPDGNNYISPKNFGVGFINDSRHTNANICSDKPELGYLIQQPYVKYNLPKISNNCSCTEFIQPP